MFRIHLLLLLSAQHHRRHNIFPGTRVLTISRVDRNTIGMFLRHKAISSREKIVLNWLLPLYEYILVSRSRPHSFQTNYHHSLRERPPEASVLKEPDFHDIWNPCLRNIQLFYHWRTIQTGITKPEGGF